MKQTPNTPLHPPMVRISSIVRIVGPAFKQRHSGSATEPASATRVVAAVHANWAKPAPVLAALTIFAFAFRHLTEEATLALVTPRQPDEKDAIAVSVLLDALTPDHAPPRIVLLSEAEAETTEVDTVFQPLGDDSDLIGIARLANTFHEIAQGIP